MHTDYEIIPCTKSLVKKHPRTEICLPQYKKEIDVLWESDPLVNSGTVFNGSLLILNEIDQISLSEVNLSGKFTGYKYFYISRNYENIPCNIHPIGVSGIILFKDKNEKLYTLIGKRSGSVSNYPGYFELLPSGNVDDLYWNPESGLIDYQKNLITEFQEETGLKKTIIDEMNLVGVIHDKKENYYDICCEIILKDSLKKISETISLNEEYEEIFVSPVEKLEEFLFNEQDYIVPTSAGLIDLYHKKTI